MKKQYPKQCKKCLRIRKWGASVMTEWKCAICGKKEFSGNACIPKICNVCAIRENRCYWCGELHK